ncbi:von Willebrand factor type A domain protein [Oesophagostomum dentatum]|uniref:von Willebrand factor type A domain protein n=1 Tax=Oesophagostomum dentatum TaxID=61180 RepID=A0A0B1TRR9_OESDE|nr:von Willebrand factor type A domain protein [Oesophagostomum dentatum]
MSFQSGVTRTGYALRRAENELFNEDRGARSYASKVIALFTDGLSIDDPLKPSEQLRLKKGVKIYVVSVSADGFIPEMQRISGVGSNVYGPDDLQLLKNRILKDVEEARVCDSVLTSNPLSNAITQPLVTEFSDLVGNPLIEMSTETLTTADKPLPPIAEEVTTLNDNEVRGKTSVHSAESRTTPLSPNEIFENVLQSVQTLYPNTVITEASTAIVPINEPKQYSSGTTGTKTQRRKKKIRRIIRRKKIRRGPGLKRIDSAGPIAPSKVRKVIRRTKVRKLISRTSTGGSTLSPLPPITSSTVTTAFPPFLRPAKLVPPKESILKNVAFKNDITVATTYIPTPSIERTTTNAPKVFPTVPTLTERRTPDPVTMTGPAPARLFVPPQVARRALASKTFAGTGNAKGPNLAIPLANCPLDVLFVVDSSGSVGDIYLKQKEFLSELLLSIQPENKSHRVALIQFAGAKVQKTEWFFDTYHESTEIIKAFNGVRHFTGTTYIGAALELAEQLLEKRRPDVKTVVVLLSDGFSQDDAVRPAEAIRAMKNVELYAVSLSRLSNRSYLHQLVKDESKMAMDDGIDYLHNHLRSVFSCNN